MTEHPLRYVVDTSVIIDLHVGQILTLFFKLPYNFVTADAILAELLEPEGQLLIEFGLQQEELSGTQILKVMQLTAIYRQPSVNDLFALVLSKELQIPLLTNDKNLRRAAIQEGVAIHGTLWILDEMVRLAVVSKQQAAHALIMMRERSSRLPQDECDKRLSEWANS